MTTLQMDNKTFRKLVGITKDVMIKHENSQFLLDIEEYSEIPLTIIRPFMKGARMLGDVDKRHVKVRIKNHEVCFNMLVLT